MALPNLSKLEKLKIEVFSTRERDEKPEAEFPLMFNPESYRLSYQNVFSRRQGNNTSGRQAGYSLSKPADFSLKIIIDGTGVTEAGLAGLAGAKKDVHSEVQKFLKLTAHMDGKLHEPKFLVVKWGKLRFPCRLKQVSITFTLFDNSGAPLRAELDTTFVHDISKKKQQQLENKQSPDLTHMRTVKAHDTLPLLCQEIYGNPALYLKVAEANRLDKFRDLVPGQQLFFPPLEK